jgi:hypothetical protein
MKRIALALALGCLLFAQTGCMGVATPAMGLLITDVKWDGSASGALGTKEGKSCATSVLALVSSGDASIEAAAKAGGITKVMSVDHTTKWTLLFGEYCTIVRGS